MARITIRLIVNPETRKRDVVIDYESDQDAMAMEHEDDHGKIVDQLIEGGTLNAAELGKIIVNRDGQEQQQDRQRQGRRTGAGRRGPLRHFPHRAG